MRITCPNCQATYEVSEEDIPDGGIEVECSACLNRWMQAPNGAETSAPQASAEQAPDSPTPAPEPATLEEAAVSEPSTPEPSAPESLISEPSIPAPSPSVSGPSRPAGKALRSILVDGPSRAKPAAAPKLDAAPSTPATSNWRVPPPPANEEAGIDPLDEILAEVDSPFITLAAADALPEPSSTPDSNRTENVSGPSSVDPDVENDNEPDFVALDETLDTGFKPEPSAPQASEPALDAVDEPSEAEPEVPVAALKPHWSEQIAVSAPAPAAVTPVVKDQDAQKGMEDLIRTLSTSPSATSGPSEPIPEPAVADTGGDPAATEEPVFHPWEGDVAPDLEQSTAEEDDEFDWDENPVEDATFEPGFDPEPEQETIEAEHIAAVKAEKDADLRLQAPEISNVIQADIPQAPSATMASGGARPAVPAKPTPVESVEDVEAAIRAQIASASKPPVKPVVEESNVKTGIFGRKAQADPAPAKAEKAKSVSPLKAALLDNGAESTGRSGKRTGFFLVVYVFLIALAIYLFGEQISTLVPALEPYINSFSAMVDQLRSFTQGFMPGG